MRLAYFFDIFGFCFIPDGDKIAVIGKQCSVKVVAAGIIRADFKTEAAFEALGGIILMAEVFILLRLIFSDEDIGAFEIFVNGTAIDDQVMNDRELSQRTNRYNVAFQIF